MTKIAMVDIYEQLHITPYIQVHDELCNPLDEGSEEQQSRDIVEIMLNAGHKLNITVPMKVDPEIGNSWWDE